MSDLGGNIETLLATMMVVIATVWSIGFVAYNFVYGYFEKRYLDAALGKGGLSDAGRARMLRRVSKNLFVYWGYLVAGVVAAASIVTSGFVLALGDSRWVYWAYVVFGVALVFHVVLFTIELMSSTHQMTDLVRMNQPRPPTSP